MGLLEPILASLRSRAGHPAVVEPSGDRISYAELDRVSAALGARFLSLGVGRGDRVGIYLRKSADAVAAIVGTLRAGSGYVPVDPGSPASRNAYILASAGVKAVVVEQQFADALSLELASAGDVPPPALIVLQGVGGGKSLAEALRTLAPAEPASTAPNVRVGEDDLAYILFTSGSTGRPKGVTLTHRNARSFVDWCSETFDPCPEDRMSAHAPFHFDLSVLDVFVALKHGATIMIIDEDLGKEPVGLAQYIADARITIWYSAPSILSLLAQRGRLAAHRYDALRTVLFAGEVFPVAHLRSLQRQLPHPAYFNLYGPTETNVCTFHRIPDWVPEDRKDPYPIGKVCSHLRGRVVDAQGAPALSGSDGELCIAGPAVMTAYWGEQEMTERAFLVDPDGTRWYRTGDIVRLDENADYVYLGRRDRMVKKRGYRVELGEIEACLYQHPSVQEAGVVALPDEELGLCVVAHLSTPDGARLSLIALKQFCSERLPVYMVPDRFVFHAALPRTSTGKTNYPALRAL